MKVEFKKPFRSAGKSHQVGDQAEVTRRTGRVLVAIKHAVEVKNVEGEEDEPEESGVNGKPRKYKRRDMTAEK